MKPAEFRRLQKEIRGSREYLIFDIDGPKESHHLLLGTATGKRPFKTLAEYLIHHGHQVVLVSGVTGRRNRELLREGGSPICPGSGCSDRLDP